MDRPLEIALDKLRGCGPEINDIARRICDGGNGKIADAVEEVLQAYSPFGPDTVEKISVSEYVQRMRTALDGIKETIPGMDVKRMKEAERAIMATLVELLSAILHEDE